MLKDFLMSHRFARFYVATALCLAISAVLASTGQARTIIDEWASVQAPPPPELKPVTVDPKTTAFLVLDLVRQTCNAQRPRCLSTIAPVHTLLERARKAGMPVVYSLVVGGGPGDILADVAPAKSDPMVASGPDKFLGTKLADILRDKAIKTVIIVGTMAHGAVLTTTAEAALRGFQVDVAVDGVSSESLYAEQYTAWHLLNAPAVGSRVTLSRTDMIQF
jgi:nicotinamidase-related amidase